MFNVHLNLSLEIVIIFEALLELEVNENTVVIVESKELVLALLVCFQFSLKGNGITSVCDVWGSTVNAMTVIGRHEWINEYTVLFILNLLRIVKATAILALVLVLLNVNQNIIREAHMNESVNSTAICLKALSFSNVAWEICKYETVLCLWTQTKKL